MHLYNFSNKIFFFFCRAAPSINLVPNGDKDFLHHTSTYCHWKITYDDILQFSKIDLVNMDIESKENSYSGFQKLSLSIRRRKRREQNRGIKSKNVPVNNPLADIECSTSVDDSNKFSRRFSIRRSFRRRKADEKQVLNDLNNILRVNNEDRAILEQNEREVPVYKSRSPADSRPAGMHMEIDDSFSTVVSRKPDIFETGEKKEFYQTKERKSLGKAVKRIFKHLFSQKTIKNNEEHDLNNTDQTLDYSSRKSPKSGPDETFTFKSLYMSNQTYLAISSRQRSTTHNNANPTYLNLLAELDPGNEFDTETEILRNEAVNKDKDTFLSTVWNIWDETITESYDTEKKKTLYNLHFCVSMKVYKFSHIQKANKEYESILRFPQNENNQVFICRYGIKPGGHGIFSEGLRIIVNVPSSQGEQMWSITNKLLFTDDIFCSNFDIPIFALSWKKGDSECLALCYWIFNNEMNLSYVRNLTKVLSNFYPQHLKGIFRSVRYFFNNTREGGSIAP